MERREANIPVKTDGNLTVALCVRSRALLRVTVPHWCLQKVAKSQGVVKEENVKGGVHIVRTFTLFLPEWKLLLVGFLISISSTLAGQFLPQLSVPYTNSLCVTRTRIAAPCQPPHC